MEEKKPSTQTPISNPTNKDVFDFLNSLDNAGGTGGATVNYVDSNRNSNPMQKSQQSSGMTS
jgi:hypothetical protein